MNPFLFLLYATFILSLGLYVHGALKYRGIESWPSVEAEMIGQGGEVISVPRQTRFGASSSSIDTRFVEFRYSVNGKDFRSTTATPDGGGVPINPLNQSWRAFYKPSSPDVAVLSPIPYQGTVRAVVAAFSGIMVLVHLFITVPPNFARRR